MSLEEKLTDTGGMMELTCACVVFFQSLNITAAWLDYTGNGSTWQTVLLRTVRWRKRGWFGGWYIWKTEVLGKLYYVRFADENEGGTVVVLVLGIRYIFVVEAGRPSRRDLMVSCSILRIGLWGYIPGVIIIIGSSMTMILWRRLKERGDNNNSTMIYYLG